MSLQRQSSADEADLEITAELPVLDVSAYEASGAHLVREREPLAATDTWIIPAPALRAPSLTSPAANFAIDENRARLEKNLNALSLTLRDVEERLTRKSERLSEIERALEEAVAERTIIEQTARGLSDELGQTRSIATHAQTRVLELQQALRDREIADESRRTADAVLHSQLAERHALIQNQLTASQRDFESKVAARTQADNLLRQDLAQARARASDYLEALQSNEGRRSVFEDLISTLGEDVKHKDSQVARLEKQLAASVARVSELDAEAGDRLARIAALDKQVAALTAVLAQRGEQLTDVERARESSQQAILSLNTTVAERDERIRALEALIAEQTVRTNQQRTELERLIDEHAQTLIAASAGATALQAAAARADQHETALGTATARIQELERELAGQRRSVEHLEAQVDGLREELQASSAGLQSAGSERSETRARLTVADARIAELEVRAADQQDVVRQLQVESNAHVARVKELEGDLKAAEELITRQEADARTRSARLEELEKTNADWRATVDEARVALADRDGLIKRLEQETADSAGLIGHIQKKITRLDHAAEPVREAAAEGATRLLIRTDGDSEVVHVLGRKTTVGRTPDNDLQIDAKFISRHHAVILAGPTSAIIEDLNSTNGVLVNNRRVMRQPLKDGDMVVIGKTQFRFALKAATSRP